jgi:hypothetical protein
MPVQQNRHHKGANYPRDRADAGRHEQTGQN